MHERIRDALLGTWGRSVASRPRPTLVVFLVLAAISVVMTVTRIEFKSDRSDLVDPTLGWNRRYAEYKDLFPRWDDLVVCMEGEAGDERVDELARHIARIVSTDKRILSADAGFDVREIGPRLFAAAPEPLFTEVLEDLGRARRLAATENANAALAVLLGRLAAEDEDPGALAQLEAHLDPYLAALRGATPDFSSIRPDRSRWLPLASEAGSGRLRFIQVSFADLGGGVNKVSEHVRWLRERIADIVDQSDLPDIAWGVTGIPAIEADETAQSIRDSTVASIAAFILITILMVAVFRGFVVPLLAAASLLVGMALSFGWLMLSVGHLQLLSVVFTVILLGLGVDFALHLTARLELVQDEHQDLPSAVSRVFRGIGPGMLTGAVTTAAAFGATAFTQFTGMKEMGIIAGGGILLCLIAMLSCFPAALGATKRWKSIIRHRPGGEEAHFAHGRLDTVDFHPRTALTAAAIIVLLMIIPATRVHYDPNILNLQPPGIESVEWERRIVEDDARSVWSALLRTTAVEAPLLTDRFRGLPEVSGVGAMGLLFPADRDERARRIAQVRTEPLAPVAAQDGPEALGGQLNLVRVGLTRRAATEGGEVGERLSRIADDLAGALNEFRGENVTVREQRVAALDAAFDEARRSLSVWVEEALAPTPLSPDDLPAMLRQQWVSGDSWLLRVYPAADEHGRSILDPERLPRFVGALRTVDGKVFGPPVQILESTRLIVREYIKAACYAVAAILLLLLLDFRSLDDALCAMLPVAIGFLGVFCMMGLFDMPLNFANIIVLPLIFGIGVDAGVHVVHRWRAEPFGRPAGLSGGTGRGITLTMLTTIIGFGCMLLAEHRGIRSLGFVMGVGLGVTLLACYSVLPALLRLRTAHWSRIA